MNIRDANWKQILSCDALDLSVVYAAGPLFPWPGCRVDFMARSLLAVQCAEEKRMLGGLGQYGTSADRMTSIIQFSTATKFSGLATSALPNVTTFSDDVQLTFRAMARPSKRAFKTVSNRSTPE
jgi:hypothetical protein